MTILVDRRAQMLVAMVVALALIAAAVLMALGGGPGEGLDIAGASWSKKAAYELPGFDTLGASWS